MKLPKKGLAFAKSVVWSSRHMGVEMVGTRLGLKPFGMGLGLYPVYRSHKSKIEKFFYVDRYVADYICSCSCGEKKVFKGA